ncbi:LuxR-like protein [Alloalcanivorax dieselolei B5]|uniref:LuxR-like protein n=1 Tax=Alcanivorax dieselolei (strain DSM 16502 / CGMCC 1.3690 / MCCC 1A00001 / B-5) TaxID=930169 RepID=K0C9M3_ALCDB|nr:LuxR family transcriptional regulator [Alloalcanivorax dieselolei]AFT69225.1 LuxR-like protein [Alloalcanivorax dieselolei B5]GGJ90896.1 hypothetical protein GCM10007426_20080 [Alloalcanivorax dieselolei]
MFYDRDAASQILSMTRVTTLARLHAATAYLIQMHGFRYYYFSLRGQHTLTGRDPVTLHNLPANGRKPVMDKEPDQDPLVHYAATRTLPMDWKQIMALPGYQHRGCLRVMAARAQHGLLSGCTVPLSQANGILARLDLICDHDDEEADLCIRRYLPYASLLGQVLLDKTRDLTRQEDDDLMEPDGGTPLTQRERECLLWASEGKTNAEIGALLGISERTVVYHVHHACEKLHARNRQHAVTKAILSRKLFGLTSDSSRLVGNMV